MIISSGKNICLVFIGAMALCPTPADAGSALINRNNIWYAPDYVKVQYAGNIGFLSVGAGFMCIGDFWQMEFLYGYVPESVGGTDIHTIAWKNTFAPYHQSISNNSLFVSFLFGLNVNVTFGENMSLFSPDAHPINSEWPSALHLAPFIGARLHKNVELLNNRLKGYDFYMEIGTIDIYLRNAVKSKTVGISDIINVAFGIAVFF